MDKSAKFLCLRIIDQGLVCLMPSHAPCSGHLVWSSLGFCRRAIERHLPGCLRGSPIVASDEASTQRSFATSSLLVARLCQFEVGNNRRRPLIQKRRHLRTENSASTFEKSIIVCNWLNSVCMHTWSYIHVQSFSQFFTSTSFNLDTPFISLQSLTGGSNRVFRDGIVDYEICRYVVLKVLRLCMPADSEITHTRTWTRSTCCFWMFSKAAQAGKPFFPATVPASLPLI